MARSTTRGTCPFCGRQFGKATISRHLESCRKKQTPEEPRALKSQTGKLFHLQVWGSYNPDYWMNIEIPAAAKLADLDNFLRDVWLECCGHMSQFTIDGQDYVSSAARELDARSMNYVLSRVLSPGMTFSHEYDFGTTTSLTLKVVAEREGKVENKHVSVLVRNEPPTFVCEVCGKPATNVCVQCIWEGEGFLCDECAKEHECGEEMFLPVVNSPRMGTCGYTGGAWG
ncbi:MAG: hypothetical protein EPO21_22480 [Chloroflexota bacterium]|nr:MAG: hypothetical protein EPO21_22480 [Chloroflexota bacterium]